MTTVHQFDDFKVGFDDDSDGELDADELVIHDDFDSAAITLSHDDNGNLTADGVYEYVYDFLDRLVEVKYIEPSGGADLGVAEYEYDGLNRRIRKQVQNFGEGVVPGSDDNGIMGVQAGNRDEHYYYAGWLPPANRLRPKLHPVPRRADLRFTIPPAGHPLTGFSS